MKEFQINTVKLRDIMPQIVDAVPVGVIQLGLDSKIQYVNSTFSKLPGYNSIKILQYGFLRYLIFEEFEIEPLLYPDNSLIQDLYPSLKFMTTENGFINLYLKWNKIFNDDNNIVGVCATITSSCSFFEDKKNDNDERELFETRLLTKNSKSLKFSGILRQSLKEKEHIQKLLIKSEVRLGAIFELSTNTMLITEDSGKILMTNLSAAEMLDIDKNELTHSSINEILIVGEYSKYHNLIQIGKHIPVTVSYKMIQNFNEFCSVLFITKRNDYSSAKISHTISLNAEFDPLFEHSPQATLVYSEDNIIYTNNAFTKLLAIDSSDKLIGKRYSEIIISHNTEAGSSDSADNRHRKIKNICLDEEKVLEVFVTEYPFVLNNKQYNVSLFELIEEKEPDSSKFLQLAQVVEQTNDLVSVTDKNGLLEYVNSAFEKFLGYSREELIGKPSSIFKSGKHDDKFYKDLWETINSGNVFFAEFYNKKKSGQIYLEAKTISPIRNESGVVTHFVSTGKDISELKKIQSALYTTGLHLRSLLKNIHDVIFYLDSNWEIKYVNQSISSSLFFKQNELINKPIAQFMRQECVDDLKNLINQCGADNQRTNPGEIIFVSKYGLSVYFEIRVTTVSTKSNQLKIILVARDISERKKTEKEILNYKEHLEELVEQRTNQYLEVQKELIQEVNWRKEAEEELRVKEERLQLAVEASEEGLWDLNIETNTIYSNEIFQKMIGILKSDAPGLSFDEYKNKIYEKDISKYLAEFEKHLNGITSKFCIEHRIKDTAGKVKWVISKGMVVLRDSENNPLRFIGKIEDISLRKKSESLMKKAYAKEKELANIKSRFVSMVSHEFRTPLATLLSSAEILEYYQTQISESERTGHFRKIEKSVEYLASMLNDVITINKGDLNKIDVCEEEFDVIEFCRQLITEVKAKHVSSTIRFVSDVENKLVKTDKKLLRQIIVNLLNNAVAYNINDNDIKFSVLFNNEQLIMKFRDNGVGISAGDQKELFTPFFRGSNVKNISGTGLGLAIVKKAIDLLKGSILVKSKINRGTLFIVKIFLNKP